MRRLLVLCLILSLSACSNGDTDATAEQALTPAASPTPTDTATPTPAPDPLEELPTGPPPRIAYVADGATIVHTDGQRERLIGQRRIGVTAFTRYRDGWIVADTRSFEETVGLAYVAGRERVDLGPCASGGAVLSDDGSRAAWMTQFCPESGLMAPTLVHLGPVAGGTESAPEVDRTGIVRVHGFIGDDVVVSGYADGVDLVGPDGTERSVPRLRIATDAQGDLVAGVLPTGNAHGAVWDSSADELLWERRATYPQTFSPDASMLVALSRRRTAILDARTGDVLALAQVPRLDIYNWTWEDDGHLLGSASAGDRSAVVRMDLSGHLTRVTPIATGEPWGIVFETVA